MNLEQYRLSKARRLAEEWRPRPRCSTCKLPLCLCYCVKLRPYESHVQFVILIHRDEAKRSIATGRLAHLVLENSLLFEGMDYSAHDGVNALIENAENHPVVLFPGRTSTNLSRLALDSRRALFSSGKKAVVFILDGTWAYARRMFRLSANLQRLPMIHFTPEKPSNFRVREQPNELCYSTVEAIHELSRLLDFDPPARRSNLIEVFDYLVDRHIQIHSERSS